MNVDAFLEVLNDKTPSYITDNTALLHSLGDFIKHEGIVYKRDQLYQDEKPIRERSYWKFIHYTDVLPEKWDEDSEDSHNPKQQF